MGGPPDTRPAPRPRPRDRRATEATRTNGLRGSRSDWEKLIPESVRDVLRRTDPAPSGVAGDLLDRADLGQLISIVGARWELFASLLGDKPTFQVKANEFRQWRNSLAHGMDPSTDQKVEIAVILRQVGRQIPVIDEAGSSSPENGSGKTVRGSRVLWVDDHPEWNLRERQVFRALGMEVVPVLSNSEAIAVANQFSFELVISDIDRGDGEGGDLLPQRLRAVGVETPVLFYVGAIDPDREPPGGAKSITNDPAILLRDALNLLSGK